MNDHTPDAPQLKQCAKCKEWKPATPDYYFRDKRRSDGLVSACKACQREYQRGRSGVYQPPSDPSLVPLKTCTKCKCEFPWTPAYFNRNRSKPNGLSTWCKKCDSISSQKGNRKNRQAARRRNKKWREKNPDYFLHYQRSNPDTVLAARIRRRNLRVNAPGDHTAEDIERQYNNQNGRCYYCGCELNGVYHKDHVIPLSRGGSNGPENIVVACPPCNRSKSTKLPHEWEGTNRLL